MCQDRIQGSHFGRELRLTQTTPFMSPKGTTGPAASASRYVHLWRRWKEMLCQRRRLRHAKSAKQESGDNSFQPHRLMVHPVSRRILARHTNFLPLQRFNTSTLQRSCLRLCRAVFITRAFLLFLWAATALTSTGKAEDRWPQFCGPRGDGPSAATNLPLVWSETNNIIWKVRVPGRGRSSPVILGDRSGRKCAPSARQKDQSRLTSAATVQGFNARAGSGSSFQDDGREAGAAPKRRTGGR